MTDLPKRITIDVQALREDTPDGSYVLCAVTLRDEAGDAIGRTTVTRHGPVPAAQYTAVEAELMCAMSDAWAHACRQVNGDPHPDDSPTGPPAEC